MNIRHFDSRTTASAYIASEMHTLIETRPQSVLGLATGDTMLDVYQALRQLLSASKVDLSTVKTFNLDEYVGLSENDPQSYYAYMNKHLFLPSLSWNHNNIHLPNGRAHDLVAEASQYEQALDDAGPVDIQLLGIGMNGHIGFNEPGTPFDSVTRVVDLSDTTLRSNRKHFESYEAMPKQAISMGIQSIMRAKRIMLVAFGRNKADIVNKLLTGRVTEDLPASILHQHPNVEIVVDDALYDVIAESLE